MAKYTDEMIDEIDMHCVGFFFSRVAKELASNYAYKKKGFKVEASSYKINKNELLGLDKENSYSHVVLLEVICEGKRKELACIPLLTEDNERISYIIDLIESKLKLAINLRLEYMRTGNRPSNIKELLEREKNKMN